MRTYSHGVIGWLLYLKGSMQQRKLAALGAMLPDVLLAIGFIFHFTGESTPSQTLHNLLHHSQLHTVTIAMHSFMLITPLMLLAYVVYKKATPLFVGMFSHAIVDMFTHQRWGYNHFFPLDVPEFTAPFSYTSTWFTIAEHLFFVAVIFWYLQRRHKVAQHS